MDEGKKEDVKREHRSVFAPRWNPETVSAAWQPYDRLKTQVRVTWALVLREMRTRFGKRKLGYLWALLQPALHMSVFYLIWSVRGREALDGMPLIVFLVTGFVPFFLFSETYSRVFGSVGMNQILLVHQNVTPFDCIAARAILEGATKIAVFCVFLSGIMFLGVEIEFFEPLNLMFSLFLLWIIGLSLGLIVESFTPVIGSLPSIFQTVIRIAYFTSGVIIPTSIFPRQIQELLLYNPLLHLIEHARFAFLPAEPLRGVTFTYPLAIAAVGVLLGLLAFRAMQRRILSQ